MIICHRCKNSNDELSSFCSNCGCDLSKSKNDFQPRIYQKKFTNVGFKKITEWIERNNIEIVRINANMQYGKASCLSVRRWYFQFFLIDYIEGNSCHMYKCLCAHGGLLKKRKITSGFDDFLSYKNVIFDMSREEHVSNGEGRLTLARFAIYDDIIYEGGF